MNDIVELVEGGVVTDPVRRYLEQVAPDIIDRFDLLVTEATSDDEEEKLVPVAAAPCSTE